MKRIPWKAVVLVLAAVAVWVSLLMFSTANHVTVISLERNMSKNQTDLKSRDCFITALDKDSKRVSGYGPSSFCSSIKVGDTVVIKDGYVTAK